MLNYVRNSCTFNIFIRAHLAAKILCSCEDIQGVILMILVQN